MINQEKRAQNSKQTPPTWLKILVISTILLGIFFRFAKIDQKVYWFDESLTSLAISGYTVAEIQQETSDGHILPVERLHKYQRVNTERGVKDTIRFLITSNPHHPPIYFVFARLWAQVVGDSPADIRSLSALLSLLLFPSIYWLCLELFESSYVGWVALGIVAVSPLHVLYAQEARSYVLWSVTITLSSATLLRAIRCKTLGSWSLYALSLTLGLYTHLLTALVAIAHGIYILVLERFRPTKILINYLLSTLAGLFLFLPWLIILLTHINEAKSLLSWTSFSVSSPFDLIAIWLTRTSRIFFDINLATDIGTIPSFALESPLLYRISTMVCCLFLLIYIWYFFSNQSYNKNALFVIFLGEIPALFLMLPDLILGGIRSISFRYELPFYLSLQLAVAYILTFHNIFDNRWRKIFSQFLLIGVLVLGIVSDVMILESDTWWTKGYGVQQLQKAQLINQFDSPLLVSSGSRENLATLLCLSHYLNAKVRFVTKEPNHQKTNFEADNNVFIVDNIINFFISNRNDEKKVSITNPTHVQHEINYIDP